MSSSNYDLILSLIQLGDYAQARQLLLEYENDEKATQWLALLDKIEQGDTQVLAELGLAVQTLPKEPPSLSFRIAKTLNRLLDFLFD